MRKLPVLLSLLAIFISCNSINNNEKENPPQIVKVDYKEQLLTLLESLHNDSVLKVVYLEEIIPTSIDEYDIFFSYYSDSRLGEELKVLNDEIGFYATKGYNGIFEKYILTYRFLNIEKYGEEFVEEVFYDIEFAIGKNVNLFCDLYQKYNAEIKEEMLEFHDIYCKE